MLEKPPSFKIRATGGEDVAEEETRNLHLCRLVVWVVD
jgi:hypothetical protein